MNGSGGKIADGLAKAINNFFKRMKYLVVETSGTQLFPNLFDRIHLRRIRWNKAQHDVFRYKKSFRFLPGCSITAEKNSIIFVLFG